MVEFEFSPSFFSLFSLCQIFEKCGQKIVVAVWAGDDAGSTPTATNSSHCWLALS
eukprot:m.116556 g.116556  ORF g.116556 m.116556 type:complete len:55 (+) comp16380_c0_seq1:126-290(+)